MSKTITPSSKMKKPTGPRSQPKWTRRPRNLWTPVAPGSSASVLVALPTYNFLQLGLKVSPKKTRASSFLLDARRTRFLRNQLIPTELYPCANKAFALITHEYEDTPVLRATVCFSLSRSQPPFDSVCFECLYGNMWKYISDLSKLLFTSLYELKFLKYFQFEWRKSFQNKGF